MRVLIFVIITVVYCQVSAQVITVEGYAFGAQNEGYLSQVNLQFKNAENLELIHSTFTDESGYFNFQIEKPTHSILIHSDKLNYEHTVDTISYSSLESNKVFVKIKMDKKQGYSFDLNILENKSGKDEVLATGITGTRIEIYNQTKNKEELIVENYPDPSFLFTFEKGNHYTLMIRKKGYLTKRIEAFVNIQGCVLCIDGLGNVKPGVTEVVSDGLQSGIFLADVLLEPVELDKIFEIKNIYYDYNAWNIRPDAAEQLNKVITLLKDNPGIIMELGSHTDARGSEIFNQTLSQNRADAAVNYILQSGLISEEKILAKGYGESMPVNHCIDNVPCTESEHQDNRRTELRILGIADDPLDNKSLSEIIQEEKLLEEVLNSEIIKIPPTTNDSQKNRQKNN